MSAFVGCLIAFGCRRGVCLILAIVALFCQIRFLASEENKPAKSDEGIRSIQRVDKLGVVIFYMLDAFQKSGASA